VLVALTTGAIALVALLRLNLISITSTDHGDIITRAHLLAEEKNTLLATSGLNTNSGDSGIDNFKEIPLHWQSHITPLRLKAIPSRDIAPLKRVNTTVSWQQGTTTRQIELETYIIDTLSP